MLSGRKSDLSGNGGGKGGGVFNFDKDSLYGEGDANSRKQSIRGARKGSDISVSRIKVH